MSLYPARINLNRLTLPQRKYLTRLNQHDLFRGERETAWMISTREQLLKRRMIEWMRDEEGRLCIIMTARGREALSTSEQNR